MLATRYAPSRRWFIFKIAFLYCCDLLNFVPYYYAIGFLDFFWYHYNIIILLLEDFESHIDDHYNIGNARILCSGMGATKFKFLGLRS